MIFTILLFIFSLVIFSITIYFIGMLWFSDIRNRSQKGLLALGLSTSFWLLFGAIGMISNAESYPFIYTLRILALTVNPYCALAFARDATGSRFLRKPFVRRMNIILPVVDCAVLLTNSLHHLYFTAYSYPIATLAPTFWIHYGVSILVWVAAFAFLLWHFYRTMKNKSLIVLFTAVACIPIVMNILFTVPQVSLPHDFVPFLYFAAFVVFTVFTNPMRQLNLHLNTLLSLRDASPDVYMIVNANGKIIESNIEKFSYLNSFKFVPGESSTDDLIHFMRIRNADVPDDFYLNLIDPRAHFSEVELTITLPWPHEFGRRYSFNATKKPTYYANRYRGYVIVLTDISEYRAMIVEINRQNETLALLKNRAEQASKTKTTFLANISHEMRTPLNAIIGLSELELSGKGLENVARDNLEKISDAGMTLMRIINDLLDISKVETGKFKLIPVKYDIPSIINDTITLNITRINEKPVKLHMHISEDLPVRLYGDELRVKQIFNNLLSNAFKYTREGTVDWTITCERDGDSVWLVSTVKDTGIGIKKEDKGKLFSAYNQVDNKSNRRIEGTGLGLSITKQLVEMMDGEITVESEYKKGSTFTVRMRQGHVTDMPIGEKLANNLMSFRYNEKKKKKDRKMVRVQIPYARVLVVDDVPTNLDVAKGMLKPYNMAVDCVMSGQQAIDLVRKASERYDAIFMDHMMPELDGVEATKIIREKIGTEYAKSVPIIALTANAVQGSEKLFLENGFQAFLPKPIDIEQLDKAVNMWVRDKEKEKALQSVDIARGIKRFSGDEESYRQVLRTYVESTPALIETLRGFGPDELTKAATVFHGIKGSSYAICADFVGKEAEALEYAAKNGDADFVKTNTELFINALKTLVADLGMLLADALHDEVKPVLDEPDKTSLEKLRRACKDYDMDGVDAAMDELEKYRYEKGNELIDWLREEINKAEFEEICESLSA